MTIRLRHLVKELKTGPFGSALSSEEYVDEGVPLINPSDLRGGTIWPDRAVKVPEAVAARMSAYRIKAGDIVLARRGELGRYGLVGKKEEGFLCGTGSLLVRPACNLDAKFFGYFLETADARDWLSLQSVGSTMENLSEAILARLPVPNLPKEAQSSIAHFLDEQTARIDALIEAKERLIERLTEFRQSWVSETLLSPPGSKVRLKFTLRGPLQYGATESGHVDAIGPRYIRITDIHADGALSSSDPKYLTPTEASPYMLSDGDVLFARSGATVGKSFVYRAHMGEAAFAGYLIRARLEPRRLLPDYLRLLGETHQYWAYLRGEETQSTIQNASAEKYANFAFILPTIPAQEQLLAKLKKRLSALTNLHEHAALHTERLREYRSALVSAAVTGQLDINSYKEAA